MSHLEFFNPRFQSWENTKSQGYQTVLTVFAGLASLLKTVETAGISASLLLPRLKSWIEAVLPPFFTKIRDDSY